jgi:hypothetical protein
MRTQCNRVFALKTIISQELSPNTLILFATVPVPLINLNSWNIGWSLSFMHGSRTYCKATSYSQLQGCNSRSFLTSLSIQINHFQKFSQQFFKEEVHVSIRKRLNSQCGRELNKDKKRAIWWGKQASSEREAQDPLATVSRLN